ncbi:MAG TPA: STAS domain-containing protein [Candidatus Dormibacteraeota bacterium]
MGRDAFVLDCSALPEADAGQLDRLSGLCLCLRRRQIELRLQNLDPRLRELVDLAGLAGVLGVEAGRQTEEREEAGGVEEEGELGDAPV